MNEQLQKKIAVSEEPESSLRLMKFAVDHASDCLFWIRPDAHFSYVNDSTCRRLGYNREELLGITVFDVDPAFPREAWDAHWREIRERKSFTIETKHRTKTGETFPVEVSVNYVEYEGVEYNFAFARDISERKRAEEILRQSNEVLEETVKERTSDLKSANTHLEAELAERRRLEETLEEYRKIVESSNDMMAIIDRDYRYLLANEAFLRYRNTGREQVIGRTAAEVLGKDIFENIIKKNLDACFQGKVVQYEMKYSYSAPGERDLHVSYYPIEETGHVNRVACVIRDITERKRAEEDLQRKKNMLTRTEGIVHIGSWEWEVLTDTVTWSDELFRIFQRDPGARAPSFAEQSSLYFPDDMALLKRSVEAAVNMGTPYELELRAIRRDGETRVCLARGHPEMGADGRTAYLFGSLQDITERKQAEEALRESEERLRLLIEHSPVGIAFSKDGVTLDANAVYMRMFGYENIAELRGTPLIDQIAPQCRPDILDRIKRHAQGKRVETAYETMGLRKDGSQFLFYVTVNIIILADGPVTISFFIDITERKQAENKIRQMQDFYQKILDGVITGVWVSNKDDVIFYANKGMGSIAGVDAKQMENISVLTGFPELTLKEFRPSYLRAKETLSPVYYESIRVVTPAERTSFQSGWLVPLVMDGRYDGMICTVEDVTERRKAEDELKRSSREWSAAMDASEDIIYLLDLDRRVLRANKTFYLMTQSTPETAIGKHIVELVHPGGEKVPCPVCQAQEEKRDLVLTMEPDHPDNPAKRPIEITLRVVRDDAGKPISMFMTLHDLTHEREMQGELTKYREHLEQLVKERTAEVEKKNADLEKMNKLFVGRELRMRELKENIRELEKRIVQGAGSSSK